MIVYSRKIIHFVNEINLAVRDILFREIRLIVERERFYDRERTSYPINIVIYNNKSMLGYFDPSFYELGFHECLMHSARHQLHRVIRHELAHYMTFINYGDTVQSHGEEFRAFCGRMGWGEEVYRATTCLEGSQEIPKEESDILRKIQKLMALSTSSNKNEAELAMIKSQQLLLKHNMESSYVGSEEDEKVFLKRIMKQKKENSKMRSIARILNTFFVGTVYKRIKGFIYLEILGSSTNIEIAEYVAEVLQTEMEHLWKQAQKLARLKGMIAKNSFFFGLAKGYCDKIQALKRDYSADTTRALMVIERKLIEAEAMVYPRLTKGRSSGSYCLASSMLGEQMGRNLNINPALNRPSSNSGAVVGYTHHD